MLKNARHKRRDVEKTHILFSAVDAGKQANQLKSVHGILATQPFLPGILPHNNQPI